MGRKGITLWTLTLLFTLIASILLSPFLTDLYEAKKELLMISQMETSDQMAVEEELLFLKQRLGESALERGERGAHRLINEPFFFKLLIGSSFIIMLMLLRRMDGAEKLLYLLPLLSLLLLGTLPREKRTKREELYPDESRFAKEAFSSRQEWQRAWQQYLDIEWEGKESRFNRHLIQNAPLRNEEERPFASHLLALCFLIWTSYSAYRLNKLESYETKPSLHSPSHPL